MVEPISHGVYLLDGKTIVTDPAGLPSPDEARENTIAYGILRSHDADGGKGGKMRIRFDAMASHDITYVGIIQTARASGLEKFPIPYAMTNCHNSLCAVGGTINEDDHVFGLSAAKKYGGIYVPANQAVIHQYVREELAACGSMVLGSDSHTRYGSLGCMGVGEGGGELVKQLLHNTWDINAPEVVLVWLEGKPKHGIGPHDVAISLVKAVFESGFVKNKVLEFAGPGVKELPVDFRNGIDVMTTETTCLSSIWITDETVRKHYETHRRPEAFKELRPGKVAWYDAMIRIDLSTQESMIALPFHPSNAFTIHELQADPEGILKAVEEDARKRFGDKVQVDLLSKIKDGKVFVEQGVIAGCAGGMYENIVEASEILGDTAISNNDFTLDVYPSSQPIYKCLTDNGYVGKLMDNGAVIKTAFCGPCFGAGDVPQNNGLSIRHTTRNFESREGSKPSGGQLAAVALMDARSIAATAKMGGAITSAMDVEYQKKIKKYRFDTKIYRSRVYSAVGKGDTSVALKYGPNIADWPKVEELKEDLLLKVVSSLHDPVTTTDELIPSGETSSYRSNPLKLAEFALSRKDPEYVGRAKAAKVEGIPEKFGLDKEKTSFGSVVCSIKPGDGSAREQAASCQRVLGGVANIAVEYATKRYRSNLINWGMIPFLSERNEFKVGDYVYIKGIKEGIEKGKTEFAAKVIGDSEREIILKIDPLTDSEKEIIIKGCLINYYKG